MGVRDRLAGAGLANPDGVRFLLSAHASHEELFMFRRLVEGLVGPGNLEAISVAWSVSEKQQPAETTFRVPVVDAPNINGARAFGLTSRRREDDHKGPDLEALRAAVDAGTVSALYVFDPGPDGSIGDTSWIVDARSSGKLPLLIVQGVLLNDLARAADFVLPGASYVEKEASYTNEQGRLQGTARAIAPPGRRRGRLADCGERRGSTRSEAGLHNGSRRSRGHRRAIPRDAWARRNRGAPFRAAHAREELAAGVEPVRAMEMGFHVPGSAAGQRQRGSVLVAGRTGVYRAERSQAVNLRGLGAAAGAAFLVALASATASAQPPPAELTPLVATDGVHPGETAHLAIQMKLPDGLHTNSNKPRDPLLIPITLTINPAAGDAVEELVFPSPVDLKQAGADQPLSVFTGTFVLGVALKVDAAAAPGDRVVNATLRYQACDERTCYAPKSLRTTWTVHVVPAGAKVSPQHADVFGKIAWGRGEKPVASPQASAGSPESGAGGLSSSRRPSASSSLDDFTLLATANGYMGAGDFTTFIHNAENGITEKGMFEGRGPLAILLIVFLGGLALNLTPCVLPMIPINLAIIGAGTKSGSRGRGFLLGGVYGAAMAVVYGVLGLVVILTAGTFGTINASSWFNAGIAAAVCRARARDVRRHHDRFFGVRRPASTSAKKTAARFLVAFGMGAIAALLAGACVAPVVVQVVLFSSDLYAKGTSAALALPFVLGVGMAVPWPIAGAGIAALPKPGAWMVRVKQVFGVIILVTAAYYGYEAYGLISNRWVDPAEVNASVQEKLKEGWHPLDEGLATAARENKLVLIDMWATWCKNCLTMDKTTLENQDVENALANYVKIKFQAEDPDEPATKAIMQRFKAPGLPTYVILRPIPGR